MQSFHIIPIGEFEHSSGIVQVIDQQAIDSMYNNYGEELFLTVDHMPHYGTESTRSYGWIKNVEKRDNGLWANIDLTVLGQESIDNKLFKWFSPEFKMNAMELIDGNKYRPIKISGLSLTNSPNMASPNAVPIFNSKFESEGVTHIMVEIMNSVQEEIIQEVLDEVKDIIEEVLTEVLPTDLPISEQPMEEETPAEEVSPMEESPEEVPTDMPMDTPTDTPEDMPMDTPTDTPTNNPEDQVLDKCGDKFKILKNSLNYEGDDDDLLNHLKSLYDTDILNKANQKKLEVESILNSYVIPNTAKDKWEAQLLVNREQTEELLNATFEKKSEAPEKPVSKYNPSPLPILNNTQSGKDLYNKAVSDFQKEYKVDYTTAFNAIHKTQGHLLK